MLRNQISNKDQSAARRVPATFRVPSSPLRPTGVVRARALAMQCDSQSEFDFVQVASRHDQQQKKRRTGGTDQIHTIHQIGRREQSDTSTKERATFPKPQSTVGQTLTPVTTQKKQSESDCSVVPIARLLSRKPFAVVCLIITTAFPSETTPQSLR
jgi:hypothetical protein